MDSAQREGIGLLLCCKMLDRFRGRGAQPENGGCQQLVVDTVAKQHHVLPVLDSSNKAMKAVPYTYTTPKWDYNPQTRRREKIGMEERTVEAASMFDVNKAIMRCLVKNLAMFGLGLYVYAGEDLPEDAAPQPEAEPRKQPKPRSAAPKQEQPPMPCICARCNQPIKRVKLKDGSIMQAAEFAATHEGMCADCYKATRLNVA